VGVLRTEESDSSLNDDNKNMRENGDNHVGTEGEVLEGLGEVGLVDESHKRVEEDQVDSQKDLDAGDVGVEVDAGFSAVED
jgi:hypothetical protein